MNPNISFLYSIAIGFIQKASFKHQNSSKSKGNCRDKININIHVLKYLLINLIKIHCIHYLNFYYEYYFNSEYCFLFDEAELYINSKCEPIYIQLWFFYTFIFSLITIFKNHIVVTISALMTTVIMSCHF